MKQGMMLFWGGLLILVVLGVGASFYSSRQPGKLDSFAQCLKDHGAIFYGAWWCPHCQNTKRMFGKSARLLPYLECSTADGKTQLQICTDKNVTNYPTWEFANGERLTGERTLQELSEKSGCPLP
jgi:hypothetical protein